MTVSDQIIQVLDALCGKFGLAIDWTNDNVVPYLTTLCSRICTYEIATSISWIVIAILMLIGAIIYFKYSWKNPIDWDEYDLTAQQFNGTLSLILLVIAIIASPVIMFVQAFDIIQATCLPELTIIDHIKNLTTLISN